MKLTFEEKKLLYTYGCADLELTRKRLYEIAGLTVDPDQNIWSYQSASVSSSSFRQKSSTSLFWSGSTVSPAISYSRLRVSSRSAQP